MTTWVSDNTLTVPRNDGESAEELLDRCQAIVRTLPEFLSGMNFRHDPDGRGGPLPATTIPWDDQSWATVEVGIDVGAEAAVITYLIEGSLP